MKKLVLILGMIFTMCGFISCNFSSNDNDRAEEGTTNELEPITITAVADLKANHKIKIQTAGEDDTFLSKGQCVRIDGEAQRTLVVSSVEQVGVTSQLCSNIDDDNSNNCEGSYNIVYKTAGSETGANKLALESTDRNESKECIKLPPVYTITLAADIGNRTIKVQSASKAKTLKGKWGCLKLKSFDFNDLQIDVGEGDDNRQVLCSNKSGTVSVPCGEETLFEANNIEISLFGRPPTPDAVKLNNKEVEYNDSENCQWFDK